MPLGSGSPLPSTRTVVLSEPVCDWLSSLREEDLELMMGATRFFQALRIVGRVLKWLIVTAATTFIGGVAVWKALVELYPG